MVDRLNKLQSLNEIPLFMAANFSYKDENKIHLHYELP